MCGMVIDLGGSNLSREKSLDTIGVVTVIGSHPADLSECLITSVLLIMLEVMADLSFILDFS